MGHCSNLICRSLDVHRLIHDYLFGEFADNFGIHHLSGDHRRGERDADSCQNHSAVHDWHFVYDGSLCDCRKHEIV